MPRVFANQRSVYGVANAVRAAEKFSRQRGSEVAVKVRCEGVAAGVIISSNRVLEGLNRRGEE